jgi:hypothetical protein
MRLRYAERKFHVSYLRQVGSTKRIACPLAPHVTGGRSIGDGDPAPLTTTTRPLSGG